MTDTPFKNAYWIWDDGDPKPVNGYRVFRKEFEVPSDQAFLVAFARISARTKFQLRVNGKIIAEGPAPSAKGYCSFRAVDFWLEHGRNKIEVIVHSIGIPIFSEIDSPAGLIFEMGEIVSDESWLVSTLNPWLESPRFSNYLGFSEIQSSEIWDKLYSEISDQPGVKTDVWKHAKCVGKINDTTFGIFDSWDAATYENLDFRVDATLIGLGNCESENNPDTAARLEQESLLPSTLASLDFSEAGFINLTTSNKDIWLLFDMGHEVSGRFNLHVFKAEQTQPDTCVDIGYSEVFDPTLTPSGLVHGGMKESFRYSDRLMLHGEDKAYFGSFSPRAFRYVRLVVRKLVSGVKIAIPSVTETTYPVDFRGAFTCSDARLDKIWEVGRRTLQLCMADTFMDCPQRERAQYIADTRIEAIGAQYCFGDTLLHKRFLIQTALGQHDDGSIDPCGPGEWDTLNPSAPIPGFMAIYVQSALDYYMHTGDGDTIKDIMPAILKSLGWLASFGGAEGGLITKVSGWNFTDWAPGLSNWNEGFKDRDPGVSAPLNLFYLESLRAATILADLAGDQAAATSCRTRASMVGSAFDSLFWSVNRGVYVDSVVDGNQSSTASQQVNSLALLSGVGSDVRKELILEGLFLDKNLTQIGSPYFSFYLVQALARCGQHRTALDYIREKWGAMLDAGATSWWETWDGTKSRCHGWSIAPTIWLTEQVLGVTPHEPGWACVNIAPKPCDLSWARGIVPTPHGDVQVAWKISPTGMILDITAPVGVHIRPIIPCKSKDLLIVDGEPVAPDSIVIRTDTEAEIAVLPGSGYRFEVVKSA